VDGEIGNIFRKRAEKGMKIGEIGEKEVFLRVTYGSLLKF
jgi:hypothetical protein